MIDEATNPFSTPPLSESATTTLIRAALVGLAAFIATACGEAAEVQAEDNVAAAPIEVETRAATVVERSRVLELSGTLQPNRQASLSPEVSGHVSRVLVERGATVEEGDPLVVLDPGDFRLAATAASARAEAQLRGIGLEEVPDDLDELDATATVTAAAPIGTPLGIAWSEPAPSPLPGSSTHRLGSRFRKPRRLPKRATSLRASKFARRWRVIGLSARTLRCSAEPPPRRRSELPSPAP